MLQIDLRAAFFLAQAAARVMIPQGGGKIINIASMLSFQGGILVPSYTAAKSGLAGITRALANEWARHAINVNAIAPGYMATENTAALRADAERAPAILERIPTGRWGEPADLQGAVVFLASSASDYVQGAILPVDGGWLARGKRRRSHRAGRACERRDCRGGAASVVVSETPVQPPIHRETNIITRI